MIGPLAAVAEPGCYDLCASHAQGLSVPKGWEFIRLPDFDQTEPVPDRDDLLALADAVREIGMRADEPITAHAPASEGTVVELARRGHLRMIADAGQ